MLLHLYTYENNWIQKYLDFTLPSLYSISVLYLNELNTVAATEPVCDVVSVSAVYLWFSYLIKWETASG